MWSWALEFIGLIGAVTLGRQHWWGWLILALNSVLWIIYGAVTGQYGFTAFSVAYCAIYLRNSHRIRNSRVK